MLRLSKKTDYAIILLTHLATTSDPVSAQEMSCKYHLPQPMVANILKQLASEGIVESKRGQQGGYLLKVMPSKITVSQIVNITDNEFSLVDCVHHTESCKIAQWCPTKDPLAALHQQIEQFLQSLTLDQILNHPQFNWRSSDENAYIS